MNANVPFARDEVLQIGKSQKAIISLILINILIGVVIVGPAIALGSSNTFVAGLVIAGRVAAFFINIIAVVFIYRMAKALRRTAWVYAVAAFLPCISLITLLVINHQATQTLRECGVRVGLLGAKRVDLEHISHVAPRLERL
jgi:hypothetical protein